MQYREEAFVIDPEDESLVRLLQGIGLLVCIGLKHVLDVTESIEVSIYDNGV